MLEAGARLLEFLRALWTALALALAAAAGLALLVQVLQAAAGTALGAGFWVRQPFLNVAGLFVLALLAFLGVPAVVQVARPLVPANVSCGPVRELGDFAAGLIAALAALRMLQAVLATAAAAALGGDLMLSGALQEAGEATFGMLLAGAAVPVAQFLLQQAGIGC